MTTKRILSSIGIGAGAIIIGLGIQYAIADWTPAPPSPPNCNDPSIPGCNAPINVGPVSQAKNAGLGLGTTIAPSDYSLDVEGGSFIDSILTQAFTLNDANTSLAKQNCAIGSTGCENGYILMNDGSGNAIWVSTSSLFVGGSVATTPGHGTANVAGGDPGSGAGGTPFNVPPLVTSITTVEVCGSGGGGAAGPGTGGNAGSCSSGGPYTVTPGQVFLVANQYSINSAQGGLVGMGGTIHTVSCPADVAGGFRSGTGGQNVTVSSNGITPIVGHGGAGGQPNCGGSSSNGGSNGTAYGKGGNGGVSSGGGGRGAPGGAIFTW